MRGKPFVDKRFSPAPPSKKLFSGRAVGPRRWTAGSVQRPVDRESRKRKAFCLPLPALGGHGFMYPVCVWELMTSIKRGGQSAFRVFYHGLRLFVREPSVWSILPGDRQW